MGDFRRAQAMLKASYREQRIWLGVAALIAICAVVSGALILYWGHRGPRSDCDVVDDMTRQWNSDVAPAKTALSIDPSRREAVLIVAGAEESFSYVLRVSTRDLSSRSIQSALSGWADGTAEKAQSRRDAIRLTPTSATPNYGPAFAQASNDISAAARELSQECPAAEPHARCRIEGGPRNHFRTRPIRYTGAMGAAAAEVNALLDDGRGQVSMSSMAEHSR